MRIYIRTTRDFKTMRMYLFSIRLIFIAMLVLRHMSLSLLEVEGPPHKCVQWPLNKRCFAIFIFFLHKWLQSYFLKKLGTLLRNQFYYMFFFDSFNQKFHKCPSKSTPWRTPLSVGYILLWSTKIYLKGVRKFKTKGKVFVRRLEFY